MTAFQEFRLWLRRAPAGERSAASVAAALALAVLAWVLVPSGPDGTSSLTSFDDSGAATGGATGGTTGSAGTGSTGTAATGTSGATTGTATGVVPGTSGGVVAPGTTGAAGSGSTTGATGAGTTGGTGPSAPACPAGSPTGVSASRMKVAVVLVNIVGPAANEVFGIGTPAEQKRFFEAVINDINASGGAGCRKIAAQFFEGNPADQNNLRQVCIDIQSAGAFAVIDGGAYAQYPDIDCYAKAGIPYFGGYFISGSLQRQHYPYLFEFNTSDRLYRDTVLALKARGFFSKSKGFSKLGFIYRSCDKPMIAEQRGLITGIVGENALVEYDIGCPHGLANPADVQQAVLKFSQEDVTHVTTANFVGDFRSFTQTAEQQGFRPVYGLPDDALVSTSYGQARPNADNIANAIAISASRSGEERTPGTKPTAGTLRCNAVFKKYGNLGNVYDLPAGAGNTCSLVWMFDAAVDNAPVLQRNALAAGLKRAGKVEWSYPQGPNDFTGHRVTTGGQFWRTVKFHRSCSCWQVLDRSFKRSFS